MFYLIETLRRPTFDPAVIQPHYAHLAALESQGALLFYGPFTNGSGGAYVVRAESLAEAQEIAAADPVHASGSSDIHVREWNAKAAKSPD